MNRGKIFTPYRVIVVSTLLVLGFAFLGVVIGLIEPNLVSVIDSAGVRVAVLIGFPIAVGAVVLDQVRQRGTPNDSDPDTHGA